MDKKSQLDKLRKISLDPPTEFPKIQCLNRPINYRETCIDYVKKTMRCVGYRDYIVAELEKLEKIEQIVNSKVDPNICNNVGDVRKVQAIKEVLENG